MEQDKEKQGYVSWHGYEYEHREKTRDWYLILGIISVAIAIAAIFFHNYLFAVLVIVSAFSLAVHAAEPPTSKEFRVDERGLKIGAKLYPYENINSFWLDDTDEALGPQLFIELKRAFIPLIIIPADTAQVARTKEMLGARLEEKEHKVPFSQTIMDYLGF